MHQMTILCGIEALVCIVDKKKNVYIYSSESDYNNFLNNNLTVKKIKNFFTKNDVNIFI